MDESYKALDSSPRKKDMTASGIPLCHAGLLDPEKGGSNRNEILTGSFVMDSVRVYASLRYQELVIIEADGPDSALWQQIDLAGNGMFLCLFVLE